jgi:hypothetical protein
MYKRNIIYRAIWFCMEWCTWDEVNKFIPMPDNSTEITCCIFIQMTTVAFRERKQARPSYINGSTTFHRVHSIKIGLIQYTATLVLVTTPTAPSKLLRSSILWGQTLRVAKSTSHPSRLVICRPVDIWNHPIWSCPVPAREGDFELLDLLLDAGDRDLQP